MPRAGRVAAGRTLAQTARQAGRDLSAAGRRTLARAARSAPMSDARRALWLAALALLLGAVGCNPGAYPIDIFPEMHYQPSYRPLEPERLAAPDGAVPVGGAKPRLTFAQAAPLANPLPPSPDTLARAQQVYAVNCAACHGSAGAGRGPLAAYYIRSTNAVVEPVAFSAPRVQSRTDGELYWIVRYGLGNMPPYDHLLTDPDLWSTVSFIRQVQGR
jgi:mono/diheme cytochrome c family protein